jgi:hypothetical protein
VTAIHITIGDTSGGEPGSRAQTFREKGLRVADLRRSVRHRALHGAGRPRPSLDVVGGALHRLVAVAPTTVRPGEPFDALVKAEDVGAIRASASTARSCWTRRRRARRPAARRALVERRAGRRAA